MQYQHQQKRKRLTLKRDKDKMEKVLGGITNMAVLHCCFIHCRYFSRAYCSWLKPNVLASLHFGMVDTNSDPNKVDFAIPANDDATKSIAIITNYITAAIIEGLQERETEKDKMDDTDEDEECMKMRDVVALGAEGAEGEEANKGAPRKKASWH
jgi:small subunit ribosomal protein S2